jgi:hypothetical protein
VVTVKKTLEIKRCPRINKCGLYPDFCPDASNSSTYKKCVIMKKK